MPNFSRQNRRGNYMMTMGSFLPILIGFAALSVDISYINMAKIQAQHSADAAAHAAFIAYRHTLSFSDGNDAADFVLSKNLIGNQQGEFVVPVDYGEWNFSTFTFNPSSSYINATRARVARSTATSNPLDLFFAPLLGYTKWDVEGLGITAGRSRQIMLVQDVSCSFGGTDILNARDADIAFLNYMANHPYPNDKLGLSLFGGRAWWPVLQELDTITGNYNTGGSNGAGKPNGMLQRFQAIDYCYNLPSWSRAWPNTGSRCNTTQARGLIQARDEFIARGSDKEFQAVILISDGLPNEGLSSGTNNGKAMSERAINQLWGEDLSGNDRRTWNYSAYECIKKWGPLNSDCDNSSERHDKSYNTFFEGGVHVWTVTFNEGGGDFSWMGTLTRGMGRAYETPNSNELDDIMIEIASSIPVVLTE
ncbi:MAG: hypothetical protein H6736_16515 [Alphaproteobacteria bacterium]|nr:hypothetical protein [Alphaproteobacteria bacterium]MCB9693418.1 hypothetical protein [Alphaproteobacteria bacterium]